eukprot:TRINITY_DN9712_c0_g4_i3.p1 TRINITY_DN9712_c0_g4~~TRINITY_DN9712_c0_g4_i3.p1  ORF type:complete len:179 (-),score=55.88 TRINITY_DN9712_c0_g4_i3:232-768(-)
MGPTNKDLLDLEREKSSFIDSTFLVCKKDPPCETKKYDIDGNAGGKLLTTAVPTSQVLGKVKDFLGVMAEANKILQLDAQEKSREDYNIEVLNGSETKYIEMDLVLGVADLLTPEAVAAAESAMAGSQPSFPSSATNIGSDSKEEDDDDEDEEKSNFHRDACSNVEQPKKRPKITELN